MQYTPERERRFPSSECAGVPLQPLLNAAAQVHFTPRLSSERLKAVEASRADLSSHKPQYRPIKTKRLHGNALNPAHQEELPRYYANSTHLFFIF
ncbi:hypothetical protein E2C01_001407 [Portunus trituberculatus]|uniref:Uncharacterized protein n=1 Tax=Portunus trituberculatus TaxID=210409 RepID=A0A5B7CMG5_PORTR|nr:hypothetical protein [Portunus trituberculatus]